MKQFKIISASSTHQKNEITEILNIILLIASCSKNNKFVLITDLNGHFILI